MRHFFLSCLSGLCHKQAAINPGTAVLPCHADKEVCLVYSFYSETLYSPVNRTKVSFCQGACFRVPLSIPQNLFCKSSLGFPLFWGQWGSVVWVLPDCHCPHSWRKLWSYCNVGPLCPAEDRRDWTLCEIRARVPAVAIKKLSSSRLPHVGKELARLEIPAGNSGWNWSTEVLYCLKVFNKMFRKGY